jgi:5-methylcytosine-specific restriction endonuclease McrA
MPTMPPTRCTHPGCGELATNAGRCAQHQRPAWQNPSAHTKTMPFDARWKRWRDAVKLRANGNCELCGEKGREADHIVPIGNGGALYDLANGMWLCHECHSMKTKQEARQRNRKPKRPTG